MTWETLATTLERVFPNAKNISRSPAEMTLHCAEGHDVTVSLANRPNPDMLKRRLANEGWRFWGKRSRCPEHATARKERKEKPEVTQPQPANDTAPAVASVDAKTAKRQAILWLDEAFDEGKGRYKEGHSDLTIANETGLSQEAVAKLREDFGYEIKEPTEIAQWREQVSRLDAQIKALQNGLEEKVAKLRSDAEDTIKAIMLQTNQLREKIEQFAKRF